MAIKSGAINYGNHHSAVNNIVDILKLVQLSIEDSIFEEQLGQKYEAEISDLFVLGIVKIVIRIPLHKYEMCIRGKSNKVLPDSD